MATRRYRYVTHHAVLRHQMHAGLPISDARWNRVVGSNGTFEGWITIPHDEQQIEAIRAATEPMVASIYVRSTTTNTFVWGGPIVARGWDGGKLKIAAMEWRAWMFTLVVPPFPNQDTYYSFDNVDQLEIAADIAASAKGAGVTNGAHPFTIPAQVSFKFRDLHFWGGELKKAGDIIDSMANRDGGFDWTMNSTISPTDGMPLVEFRRYFPEMGNVVDGLVFKATSTGGNCTPGALDESAATRYSRFWATGSGTPPDQLFAYDEDPMLASGSVLRMDGSASYSTVSQRPTLSSNARRARRFYQPGISNITVSHNMKDIDPESYEIGDRARVIFSDRWATIDRSQVRIVDKEVSSAGAGSVKLTLDLTDDTLPEVDTGGSV
jgi:hypothetical protein